MMVNKMASKGIEIIEVDTTAKLADVLIKFKSYKTVTDVGASMISGYGTITRVEVDHDMEIIELICD